MGVPSLGNNGEPFPTTSFLSSGTEGVEQPLFPTPSRDWDDLSLGKEWGTGDRRVVGYTPVLLPFPKTFPLLETYQKVLLLEVNACLWHLALSLTHRQFTDTWVGNSWKLVQSKGSLAAEIKWTGGLSLVPDATVHRALADSLKEAKDWGVCIWHFM